MTQRLDSFTIAALPLATERSRIPTDVPQSRLTILLLALASWSGVSRADFVDFEAQGTGRGGQFTGQADPPLSIGIATFIGGQVLNGETGLSNDATAVYATYSINGPGYSNPLRISFGRLVDGLTLLLANEQEGTYTVADDVGDSITRTIPLGSPTTASSVFDLGGFGIGSVTIAKVGRGTWDFAIDDVSFTPRVSAVPEPSSFVLMAFALALVIGTIAKGQQGL